MEELSKLVKDTGEGRAYEFIQTREDKTFIYMIKDKHPIR